MEKPVKIIIAIFVFSLVGFFAYTQFKSWHRDKMEAAVETERGEWRGKVAELGKEVETLRGVIGDDKDPSTAGPEVTGESALTVPSIPPAQVNLSCDQVRDRITSFLNYLDQKNYAASHGLEGSSYDLFVKLVEDLAHNPPVITGEMDDLSTLIRNVTHFYRVLGKKRIEWAIDILKHESKPIESIMETLYQWVILGDRCKAVFAAPPPLKIAYRYSGFFLNTLGGRSYLLRRESRTRMLTSFYCILVLDHSNDKIKNSYGIDIRPYIDFSFYDIKSQKSLAYQDRYLVKLQELKKKYPM